MAKPPAKRPRGRPPTGSTPSKDRTAKSREALAREGGKRLDIRLSPDGALHLDTIMAAENCTKTAAVHIALSAYVWSRSL